MLKGIWHFIYQYMGVGFIIWMIHPPIDTTKYRKPSNFLLWIVGLHVGLMGIAYQRYENAINRWHNNYNVLIERLGDEYNSTILQLINDKKNEKIPVEPSILDVTSVYRNFNENWNEPYFSVLPEVDKLLSLYIPNHSGVYSNLTLSSNPLVFDKVGSYTLLASSVKEIEVINTSDFIFNNSEVDFLRIRSNGFEFQSKRSDFKELNIQKSLGFFSADSIDSNVTHLTISNSVIKESNISLDTVTDFHISHTLFASVIFDFNNIKDIDAEEAIFYKCVFMKRDIFQLLDEENALFYECLIFDPIPEYKTSNLNMEGLEGHLNSPDYPQYFSSWSLKELPNDTIKLVYEKAFNL